MIRCNIPIKNERFGSSNAISEDRLVVVGATLLNGVGSVYVYKES